MEEIEFVSVPKGLLAEVLDTAEGDSRSTEAEFACGPDDYACYAAERQKIDDLRRAAGIAAVGAVSGQGFFGMLSAIADAEKR